MNRLDQTFLKRRPLLACYLPVGDPLIPVEYTQIYVDCGVDILELGMPSSNPYLDGDDVSGSMARALAAGEAIRLLGRFTAAARAGREGPACVSMCYADFDVHAALSASAYDGIDGLLMLGLETRDDRSALKAEMQTRGIRLIGLVPADFTQESVAVARLGEGYVMLQAAVGVTGPRATLDPANRSKIALLRDSGVDQPILLGFGIGTPEQAAEAVAMGADGVVIGSMCVRKAAEGPEALRDFLSSVRQRLDG